MSFKIKSFTDEFNTEEVDVEAEEGRTILDVAQEYGASINCIEFLFVFVICFSVLRRQLSLWRLSYQVSAGCIGFVAET